jgi:hypothetical protein
LTFAGSFFLPANEAAHSACGSFLISLIISSLKLHLENLDLLPIALQTTTVAAAPPPPLILSLSQTLATLQKSAAETKKTMVVLPEMMQALLKC